MDSRNKDVARDIPQIPTRWGPIQGVEQASDRDKEVHQRALFWLMNSPLTQSEVEEVLKEFIDVRGLGNAEEPLDRGIVKLLVLSLSSVLENGRITEDEQPIFDHCTRFLTEEMGRIRPENSGPERRDFQWIERYIDFDTSALSLRTLGDAYGD